MAATRAATLELAPIDPDDPGRHHYPGPLLADLQFSEWSASALRRITDEACLQGHLLVLSFLAATSQADRGDGAAVEFGRRQFTGVAGVAADAPGRAGASSDSAGGGRAAGPPSRRCSPTSTSAAMSNRGSPDVSGWAARPTPWRTGPGRRCWMVTTWPPSTPWSGPSTPTFGARPSRTITRGWSWRWFGVPTRHR